MRKNWLFYGLLTAVCAFFASIGERAAFLPLYGLLLLPVVSVAATYYFKGRLRLNHSLETVVALKNQPVKYSIKFKNPTIMPFPFIRLNFDQGAYAPLGLSYHDVSLLPKDKLELEFVLSAPYRGVYLVAPKKLEVFDLLGLFRFNLPVPESFALTVLPVVKNLSLPIAANRIEEAATHKEIKDEDFAIIEDVREYRDTDSFKKIHWKLSAKKNGLMVKNFQHTAAQTAVFLVNTHAAPGRGEDRLKREDWLVEAMVSGANDYKRRQMGVEVLIPGAKQEAFDTDFAHIYDKCASVTFEDGADEGEFLEFMDLAMYQRPLCDLVVFTSVLTEALAERLLIQRSLGHNVILFYQDDYGQRRLGPLYEAGVHHISEGNLGDREAV